MKSRYSQVFDSNCIHWENNQELNLMFLKSQQMYYNDILRARGYVFLRDIYEDLGFPITRKALFTGWVYDLKHPMGDNYIDFGIIMNGNEPDIELDFNVDGDITNRFEEES